MQVGKSIEMKRGLANALLASHYTRLDVPVYITIHVYQMCMSMVVRL